MSNLIYLVESKYYREVFTNKNDALKSYHHLERDGADDPTVREIDLDKIKPLPVADETNRIFPKIRQYFIDNPNPYLYFNDIKKTKTGITVYFGQSNMDSNADSLTCNVLLDYTLKKYKQTFPNTKLSVRVKKERYAIIK